MSFILKQQVPVLLAAASKSLLRPPATPAQAAVATAVYVHLTQPSLLVKSSGEAESRTSSRHLNLVDDAKGIIFDFNNKAVKYSTTVHRSPRQGDAGDDHHHVNNKPCVMCILERQDIFVRYTDVAMLRRFVDASDPNVAPVLLPRSLTGLCKRQYNNLSQLVRKAVKAGLFGQQPTHLEHHQNRCHDHSADHDYQHHVYHPAEPRDQHRGSYVDVASLTKVEASQQQQQQSTT